MLCVTFALICWRWNRGGLPKKARVTFTFDPGRSFAPGLESGPGEDGDHPMVRGGRVRKSENWWQRFLISHYMFFREDKKANHYLFKFLLFCRWPRRLVRREPCLNQFSQSQLVWSEDLILQEICCWKVVPGRLYCFHPILFPIISKDFQRYPMIFRKLRFPSNLSLSSNRQTLSGSATIVWVNRKMISIWYEAPESYF